MSAFYFVDFMEVIGKHADMSRVHACAGNTLLFFYHASLLVENIRKQCYMFGCLDAYLLTKIETQVAVLRWY